MNECFSCSGGDFSHKVRENIERVGCSIVGTGYEDESGQVNSMTYSIGLTETYGAPELVIMGLVPKTAAVFINMYADFLKQGKTFEENKEYTEFSEYLTKLKKVSLKHYEEYMHQAYAFNTQNNQELKAFQLIFPDVNGYWAEDKESSPEFKRLVNDLSLEEA